MWTHAETFEILSLERVGSAGQHNLNEPPPPPSLRQVLPWIWRPGLYPVVCGPVRLLEFYLPRSGDMFLWDLCLPEQAVKGWRKVLPLNFVIRLSCSCTTAPKPACGHELWAVTNDDTRRGNERPSDGVWLSVTREQLRIEQRRFHIKGAANIWLESLQGETSWVDSTRRGLGATGGHAVEITFLSVPLEGLAEQRGGRCLPQSR